MKKLYDIILENSNDEVLNENSRNKKMRKAFQTAMKYRTAEEGTAEHEIYKKSLAKIQSNNTGRLAGVNVAEYKADPKGVGFGAVGAAQQLKKMGKRYKEGKEDPTDLTLKQTEFALGQTSGSKVFKDDMKYVKEKNESTISSFVYQLNDPNYIERYLSINESILDPVNNERCSDIFINDVMKASVRDYILKLSEEFRANSNIDFNFRALYLVGSVTGYQYTLTSDIDVTAMIDAPQESWSEFSRAIPKGVLLPGTQRPINFFVITVEKDYDFKHAENVYDIQNNKWLKMSDKTNIKVPYPYIRDLSTFFMNGCDLALSRYNMNKQELEEYMSLNPDKQEISQKEKTEAIDRKIIDLKNDLDVLRMAHHIIWSFEQEGYNGMPFKINVEVENQQDPRYSVNNLVYKMIDKFGYLAKIDASIKEGWKLIEKYEAQVEKENVAKATRETEEKLNALSTTSQETKSQLLQMVSEVYKQDPIGNKFLQELFNVLQYENIDYRSLKRIKNKLLSVMGANKEKYSFIEDICNGIDELFNLDSEAKDYLEQIRLASEVQEDE